MAKKKKLSTPAWITEGYDSEADYNKAKGIDKKKKTGKTFKVRRCPKCNSDEIGVVIGEVGKWECRKCKWSGKDVKEDELEEDEFMKYLDEKGEDVA
jgi:ribosomal protein L37AE/L43A